MPDCGYQLFSFIFLENQTSPGEELGRADRVLDVHAQVQPWPIAGLVLDSPESCFEHSQLVCPLSVWILDPVKFDLNFFSGICLTPLAVLKKMHVDVFLETFFWCGHASNYTNRNKKELNLFKPICDCNISHYPRKYYLLKAALAQ